LVLFHIFLYDDVLNIIMFLFIMFLIYSSSTFDMVMIDDEFMYMFAKRLALISRELGGRSHVSVVLRCYLPANVTYWLGRVVVHGSYNPVESFVVVGEVEFVLCRRKLVGSLPWGMPTVVVYR